MVLIDSESPLTDSWELFTVPQSFKLGQYRKTRAATGRAGQIIAACG
jgi:hypothetical protein